MSKKIVKSEEEWRRELTPEQFEVARKKGTERAFTGKYWDLHDQGVFKCACCGTELFKSQTKYDSGSGWPSFWAPIDEEKGSATEEDASHGMSRIEAKCSTCDAHLGHVFPDGPKPTNLRFCINSASLDFKKEE